MVWSFVPVDPLSGEEKFYIFAPGKYKVGRKGCELTITKDKGVSRVHAEIVVDAMFSVNSQQSSLDFSTKVRISDCSKYGTYVSRNSGLKEKIHELPNKEASLYDGDVVSFGSGSATYRFSFVPLLFYVHCSESFQVQLLRDKVSSIGASTSHGVLECTHVLVEELVPFNAALVDAIVAAKPFVLTNWVELLAGKSYNNEIPRYDPYLPNITVEGMQVKVVDPNTRKNCLSGYTFLLGLTHMYKYGNQLKMLLQQVGGAMVLSMEDFSSGSQDLVDGENDRIVFVSPGGSAEKIGSICKVDSYYSVNELVLISAVLSGKLDRSKLTSPCEPASSTCSTDETVVAESDLEVETVTSVLAAADVQEPKGILRKPETSINNASTGPADCPVIEFRYGNNAVEVRRDKVDECDSTNTDIIYSQDLIVRYIIKPSITVAEENSGVVDFKCFRKKKILSGNSFDNFVPFSKDPYRDSGFGSEEVAESVKEEKKRKETEAAAEDLFRNEKGRRRGVVGSVQGLFART